MAVIKPDRSRPPDITSLNQALQNQFNKRKTKFLTQLLDHSLAHRPLILPAIGGIPVTPPFSPQLLHSPAPGPAPRTILVPEALLGIIIKIKNNFH
jgi:hypothetical protein